MLLVIDQFSTISTPRTFCIKKMFNIELLLNQMDIYEIHHAEVSVSAISTKQTSLSLKHAPADQVLLLKNHIYFLIFFINNQFFDKWPSYKNVKKKLAHNNIITNCIYIKHFEYKHHLQKRVRRPNYTINGYKMVLI